MCIGVVRWVVPATKRAELSPLIFLLSLSTDPGCALLPLAGECGADIKKGSRFLYSLSLYPQPCRIRTNLGRPR